MPGTIAINATHFRFVRFVGPVLLLIVNTINRALYHTGRPDLRCANPRSQQRCENRNC